MFARAAFVMIFVCAAQGAAQTHKMVVAPAAVQPMAGDYLSESYLKVLDRTRSPHAALIAAGRGNVAQLVLVTSHGSRREIAATHDWRSVNLMYVERKNGVLARDISWHDDQTAGMRFADSTHLCLGESVRAEACFARVGDAGKVIFGKALAGHYRDAKGGAARIDGFGNARIGGVEMKLSLMLDSRALGFDAVTVEGSNQIMAFAHLRTGGGGNVLVFEGITTRGGHLVADPKRVIAALHQI